MIHIRPISKKIVLCLLLTCAVLVSSTCPAFGYSLTGEKMNFQLWYRPHADFLGETRESFRSAMSTWNTLLPEWRRLCFDDTSHYLPFYPTRDLACSIYKTYSGGDNYVAQNTWWFYEPNHYVEESDIDINANYSWTNGAAPGKFDVGSIFFHETGHTVGLNHSQYSDAIMYAYSYPNTVKKTLHWDDIDGVNAIY